MPPPHEGRPDAIDALPADPDLPGDPGQNVDRDSNRDAAPRGGAPAAPDVFANQTVPRRPRLRPGILTGIACGGFCGGLSRYAITLVWPTPSAGFPWSIFTVNTGGAFTLALLLVLITDVWAPATYTRPVLATGFLGAFTTFSSVVTTTSQLATDGHPHLAALYLAGSIAAGLSAGSFGLVLGRAIAAYRHQQQ